MENLDDIRQEIRLTAASDDAPPPTDDSWIIDGMLPIAAAHAEAAAKAAGISIGEWLSQLLIDQTGPLAVTDDPQPPIAAPETSDDGKQKR